MLSFTKSFSHDDGQSLLFRFLLIVFLVNLTRVKKKDLKIYFKSEMYFEKVFNS